MKKLDLDFAGLDVNMLDVNIKHLYYFIVVAESGSMTRAAQRLYVTQPLLSKNINALEAHFGVPLFYRKGKTLVLTKNGRFLYERWKHLIAVFRNDMMQNALIQPNCIETLRIGCMPLLNSNRFLKPMTDRLYQRYPGVTIEMHRMNYIRLLDHLNDRRIDVIFTDLQDLPENREPYEWEIIRRVPITAVVSADNPLSGTVKMTMEKLSGEVLLLNKPEGNLSREKRFTEFLNRNKVQDCKITYVNNDLTAYLEAEHNHGIALGIRALYPVHNSAVRLLDIEKTEVCIAAVWNRDIQEPLKAMLRQMWE